MSRAARPLRPVSMETVGGSPPASPTSGEARDGDGLVKARSVRLWSIVHRWTSLVATLFLLLLCLTGLPLIFHHEIDEALGYAPRPEQPSQPAQHAKIDDIARAALADTPDRFCNMSAGIVTTGTS